MDNRNLILATVLSVAILLGFQLLFPPKPHPVAPAQTTESSTATAPAIGAPAAAAALLSRADAIKANARIAIATDRLKGSINLKGARLDDLTLLDYHETVDPKSPAIDLLSPSDTKNSYISEQGWMPVTGLALPDKDTVWQSTDQTLSVGHPVTLTWDNGAGLVFSRTVSVDGAYVFTITQSVANHGSAPVSLRAYALVERNSVPTTGTTVSYEGPIAAFAGVEVDYPYGDLAATERLKTCTSTRGILFFSDQHGNPIECDTNGGWLGFSDKYWLSVVAPVDQASPITATFTHAGAGADQQYQADYVGPEIKAEPGASASAATLLFAGPKEVKLLAHYRDSAHLPRFDNAVDWGWFYFITKPIFYLLDYIYTLVGNFGIAILILTVVIKGLFFPLQTRMVVSMNKMRNLQPKIASLREKYADDAARLNQETMALYKQEGANPVAGCLPMLLQVPVFFSLYKVLYTTIEMRHAPFFGWIHDLSAPDPTSLWNAFGLIPFSPPHFLPIIGVWPLLYCLTMYLQQRVQPMPADPTTAKMMQYMPLVFTFMFSTLPAGLVIYYCWNNLLTLVQQFVITRYVAPSKTTKPVKV